MHLLFRILKQFIVDTYDFSKFQYYKLTEKKLYGNYEYPYQDVLREKRVYLLANGPSLKNELSELIEDKTFLESQKCVVNNFYNSIYFQALKPEYYCIADPAFFKNSTYDYVFEIINRLVSWPMNLYIPNWGLQKTVRIITNSYIAVVPVTPLIYTGYESLRYKYYKSGKGVPSYVNVTIMMEYILLNLGCKDIRLYGVDHSFLADLCVNEKNQLCIIERHFHEKDHLHVVDIHQSNGELWHMKDFIYNKYLTFLEHERMRGYADYLGAKIINCTKQSMIDAYERLARLEKEEV